MININPCKISPICPPLYSAFQMKSIKIFLKKLKLQLVQSGLVLTICMHSEQAHTFYIHLPTSLEEKFCRLNDSINTYVHF